MGIPKQFITVNTVPILVYTLSFFETNPLIDRIVVVCVDGWEKEVERYRTDYQIKKIYRIIPGGSSGMESITNGIRGISDYMGPDDIVVIHDGVRPLISDEIIDDCIRVCKKHGNGCASIPMHETIVKTKDGICGNINIDRSDVMRVQTPQAYRYKDILDMYNEAEDRGITNSIYANTLLLELGGTVYFSKGSSFNLKNTTTEDIDHFEAILELGRMRRQKASE